MTKDYLSEAGYGALMGLLHNYEVINPITTNSIDGFERLVPGFEAPVCIVTSLGHTYETPSRNRSVLVGLIRDAKKPKSLRFELRSSKSTFKYIFSYGSLLPSYVRWYKICSKKWIRY